MSPVRGLPAGSPVRGVPALPALPRTLTLDQAMAYIGELELELHEFQLLSKQIEQELEAELQTADTERAELRQQLAARELDLKNTKQKMAGLSSELVRVATASQEATRQLQEQVSQHHTRLVDVETLHDGSEQMVRQLQAQLAELHELNSVLLEKNAELESEVEHTKAQLVKEQLGRANEANEASELRTRLRQAEQRVRRDRPASVEVLPLPAPRLKRTDSRFLASPLMQQLHEMMARQEKVTTRLTSFKTKFLSSRNLAQMAAGHPAPASLSQTNVVAKAGNRFKQLESSLNVRALLESIEGSPCDRPAAESARSPPKRRNLLEALKGSAK